MFDIKIDKFEIDFVKADYIIKNERLRKTMDISDSRPFIMVF